MAHYEVTLAAGGENATFQVEAATQRLAVIHAKNDAARYMKSPRWRYARVERVRESWFDPEDFSRENPLITDALALVGLAVLSLIGYGLYAASKAPRVTVGGAIGGQSPATMVGGGTDPATNLALFNRFTDADLTGLTALTNGLATKTTYVQVTDSTGTTQTLQVGGYPASGAPSLWYGSLVEASPSTTNFAAADVSAVSSDGTTWSTGRLGTTTTGVTS